MPVKVGPYEFDQASYHELADSLDLRIGKPAAAVGDAETPEGHTWFYPDEQSAQVVGLEITNARQLLEQDGALRVTLPNGDVVAVENVPAGVAA